MGRPRRPAAVLAAVNHLADLARTGWLVREKAGRVEIAWPPAPASPDEVRERSRAQLLVERDEQLRQPAVRKFVRSMETRSFHSGRHVSVFNLLRDGRDLAARLGEYRDGRTALTAVLRPYLQFPREEDRCPHTGLRLLDVWRYFRSTWSSAQKSVPGRSMPVLIRDAAGPSHPVIGIAALSSAPPGVAPRDEWIGWTPRAFVERLRSDPSDALAAWLQRSCDAAINELFKQDLLEDETLTVQALKEPSLDLAAALEADAKRTRTSHYRLMEAGDYKKPVRSETHWDDQARSLLFRSKRLAEFARC